MTIVVILHRRRRKKKYRIKNINTQYNIKGIVEKTKYCIVKFCGLLFNNNMYTSVCVARQVATSYGKASHITPTWLGPFLHWDNIIELN